MFPDSNGVIDVQQTFIMTYYFELEQKIIINIIKQGRKTEFNTTLGTIVGSRNLIYKKKYE